MNRTRNIERESQPVSDLMRLNLEKVSQATAELDDVAAAYIAGRIDGLIDRKDIPAKAV